MTKLDDIKRKAKEKMKEYTGDDSKKRDDSSRRSDPAQRMKERRNSDNSIV